MKKYAPRAVFLIVCFLATSCDSFDARELYADNLDTLTIINQQNQDNLNNEQSFAIIRKYLGKRPSDVKLLETEPLKSALMDIMGNEYEAFVEMMQNAAPLKEEKLIYSVGSLPDLSRIGFGYIIIDPDNNLLRAGIVKPGYHRTFGTKVSEMDTPAEIDRKCKSIL
ncbi:MAG: hypothetical protein IPH20_03445 [Bacteroidales bacterium]|nr:hypothetical protein [Bacteroidales bacterium]